MFIVITGLDGSGTTTIAEKLHRIDKGSILLHTPTSEYNREPIDDNVRSVSQNAHYLYYLSSVVYVSDLIKQMNDYKEKNIYCVRYLIDTVVSHRAAGLEVPYDYETYNIIKPDLTIFVTVDEKIRQERITKRGKSNLDKVLDDDVKRKWFNELFDQLEPNKYVFNNSSCNTDESIAEFYNNYIRRLKS